MVQMKQRTIRAKWVKQNEFNVTVITEDNTVTVMNFRITNDGHAEPNITATESNKVDLLEAESSEEEGDEDE